MPSVTERTETYSTKLRKSKRCYKRGILEVCEERRKRGRGREKRKKEVSKAFFFKGGVVIRQNGKKKCGSGAVA